MQLVQRYPYNTFNALNHFFGTDAQAHGQPREQKWSPAVDITEIEDRFEIVADVPGLTSEDVDVSVEKRVLTVSGSRSEPKEESETTVRSERVVGSFNRKFTLPKDIDVDQISAKVENGVLAIIVPKSPESSARQISVQSAA